MSGQDDIKGAITNFSIGLGTRETSQAVSVTPPPPFRVLIAADFGLGPETGVLNITSLDVGEILESNQPDFVVRAPNGLGSDPAVLEERIALQTEEDLMPAVIAGRFRFFRDVDAAKADQGRLSAHGQRYDKVLQRLQETTGASVQTQQDPALSAGRDEHTGADSPQTGSGGGALDELFSRMNTPGKPGTPSDSGEIAKAAVDAFVRKTLSEESPEVADAAPAKNVPLVDAMIASQSRAFFDEPKLGMVLENWQGLNLLLSELPASLPFEMHLLQLDKDLTPAALTAMIGGYEGVLQGELYDVALFANRSRVDAQEVETLKTIARACAESDTVGLISLDPGFSGRTGEELAGMEAPNQFLDELGFESFRDLRDDETASHVALFWNEARLSPEEASYPSAFAPAAWAALALVLAQLDSEVFPRLPVGVPTDFDALEIERSLSTGETAETAVRYHVGPDTALSLAHCGINLLAGVANRTSLMFRGGVTLQPGEEGRNSLDQALLVSRLFSLFQEALGGALTPDQTVEMRGAAIGASLERLSGSLSGEVVFELSRVLIKGQDLIGVTASISAGWASGQSHTFYLPATG